MDPGELLGRSEMEERDPELSSRFEESSFRLDEDGEEETPVAVAFVIDTVLGLVVSL